MSRRHQRDVAAALHGCRADVVGPLRQSTGAHVDIAVFPGAAHLILLSFAGRTRRARTRSALRTFDPAQAWVGPLGPAEPGNRQGLRLLLVPGKARPVVRDGVTDVGMLWLARSLRAAHDPDDVWLALAALDHAVDGWIPLPGTWAASPPSRARERIPIRLRWLLRHGRLPPWWAWQSVHQNATGSWQLFSVTGPTMLAATPEASCALLVDVEDVPDLDRALTVGFAEAILVDLVRARAALSPWRDRALRRQTRLIRLLPSWQPRQHDGSPATDAPLEFRSGPVTGGLAVILTGDLPLAAAEDPSGLREVLARCVAGGAGAQEGDASHAAFLDGWMSEPPAIEIGFGAQSLGLRGHDEQLDAILLPELDDRFSRVAAAGLSPRNASDEEARELVNTAAVPALMRALDDLMLPVDGDQAVLATVGSLQALLSTHIRHGDEHANALNGPWAADHRGQEMARPDHARSAARAAELVAEVAIRHGSRPGRAPDRIDVRLWAAAASSALHLALRSQAAYAGLTTIRAAVTDDLALQVTAAGGRLDDMMYLALRQLHDHESAASNAIDVDLLIDPTELDEDGDVRYRPLGDADPEGALAAAEQALLEAAGTRLGPIFAILRSAADLPYDEQGVAIVGEGDLVADVAAWSDESEDELRAALALLTLDSEMLRASDFDFWRLERRSVRLATRPFVRTGNGIAFAPARARGTQLLLAAYLNDGRVPWVQKGPSWDRVRQQYGLLRARGDRQFERNIAQTFKDAGLDARANVQARPKGLEWLPGEVDVLAADAVRKRLWVVEAKNPQTPFSAMEISDEVGDIHGQRWPGGGGRNRRDEAARLRRKADICLDRLSDCLEYLGTHIEQWSDWTVHPLVVTPQVCGASLFDDPVVLFAVSDQLPELLAMPDLPAAGLVMVLPEVRPPSTGRRLGPRARRPATPAES